MRNTQAKHPKSLGTFFTTEMWERYGFYVVQTLLALYLAMHMGWQDARVYELVGSFTALTYISPVIGGWIADNLIGQKSSVMLATLILCISYLILTYIRTDHALCLSLSGITVGTGLLKPNISSLLGNQYQSKPTIRESGFTIFYMGITLGIILGTTLPSYISYHFGWSSAFLSASIGMVFAAITFLYGIYFYKIQDYYTFKFDLEKYLYALGISATLWLSAYFLLSYPSLADSIFIAVAIICIFYVCSCITKESKKQAKRTVVIGLLCLISIIFWTFYFQMFMSLTLFIVRAVKNNLFNINFPPPYYVGIQSAGMIAFGFILSRLKKQKLSKAKQAARTGNKFFLSICCMTVAYGMIMTICYASSDNTLISPLLLIPAYLIISLAELLLSPIGLSAVTLLACNKKVSTMLGVFFVSLGIGGYLSGRLAIITALPVGMSNALEIKQHYAIAFSKLFIILVCSTVACAIINYLIKRLMTDK